MTRQITYSDHHHKEQYMAFAQQLRTLRGLRGLTQDELATKTGIHGAYLSIMETGKVIPIGDWETKIKQALDWPDDSVFAALMPQEATS